MKSGTSLIFGQKLLGDAAQTDLSPEQRKRPEIKDRNSHNYHIFPAGYANAQPKLYQL